MVMMEADIELTPDYFGDTCRGPKGIGPAVGLRPLAQKLFEPFQLRVRKSARPMGMRLGSQRRGSLLGGALPPTIQRRAIHAQESRNYRWTLALRHQFDSTAPPAFEFFRGSNRSAHEKLDAPVAKTMLFLRSCQ